jgi:hypothetical protein
MNKKLIKQLKKVGFEFNDSMDKDYLRLCHEGNASFIRYVPSIRKLLFFKSDAAKAYCTEYLNTFDQIAEKVLEVTLKPLTPRQTKRQEIDTLREELETVKSTLNNLSDWAMSENKRRDVDLRVLKYNLKKNGILVDPLTEPKSEPEKTEGVFKVGDPVVLSSDVCHYSQDIVDEHKKQTVFIVNGEEDGEYCLANKNGIEFGDDSVYYFSKRELQHAPKEAAKVLEFGGWAELMQNLGGWAKGTKVLLISKVDQSPESVLKFFLCANGDGEHQKINSDYLKAL